MNELLRRHTLAASLCWGAIAVAGCAQGKIDADEDGSASSVDGGGASGCTSDEACDDGIDCTVETCDLATGACASEADDARCEPSEMCVADQGCVLRPPCEADDDCDDGMFCNGTETCDPALGCQSGVAPTCDDGRACTVDACDPEANACANVPDDAPCGNGIVCDGVETCAPEDEAADANGCVAGAALECDDGIECTADACSEGAGGCEHTPDHAPCGDGVFCDGEEVCDAALGCVEGAAPSCDDGIECTTDACDAASDACAHTPVHAVCDDAEACNGVELCEPGTGCVDGTPVSCDDGLACTTDRCFGSGMCEHLGSDADGDGYTAIGCDDGTDCDDLATGVNPGATEVCDGIDNDCSGAADDGGGMECVRGAVAACATSCGTAGMNTCNAGCQLTPCVAATETCNDCDDDGDGVADDGFACRLGTIAACVTACGTSGTQACRSDCGGYGACVAATETCNNCDDDGDGTIDEGFDCRRGATESCTTGCGTTGTETCALDCGGFGACIATEACNGCDDDGDGVADDGFTCRQSQLVGCTTACGTPGTQQCNGSCSGFGACVASSETCGNACDDDGDGTPDDGCGAPNEVCSGATVLSGASGALTDTYSNASRTVSGCGSGGELWYRITLAERRVLYVDTLGSTFDTQLSIRTGCGSAAVQCEDDDCGVQQEQLVLVLPAGTYYVAVHAFSASTTTGTVQLRWQSVRVGNGAYSRVTTNGTFSGATSGTGTMAPSCGTGAGPESGFYFTVCPGTSRSVTASTCNNASFDTIVSLRSTTSELDCSDDACGVQSSASGNATGPGVFVAQVDGYFSSSYGAYSLAISGL